MESIMQPGTRFLCASSFFVLVLLLAGCSSKQPNSESPEPPKVTVSKPIVKENEVDTDEYNGWLVARDPVEIRSRVRGFLKEIHFKDPPKGKPAEGEIVKKGDLLFELDPDDFQDQIVLAEQKVKVAKAQREAADKELTRLTELEKRGGASKAQVEKADADVKSLDASIKAAEAEVSLRKRDLEVYSKIKAPIEGRIGRSLVSVGELIKQGETLLATINSINPIKVQFDMDEPSVQRYRKRAAIKRKDGEVPQVRDIRVPITFKLDTDADFTREGFIDFADNQTDPKTGKILVRGEAKNKNGVLLPGDHVRVRVPISDPYQAMLVPDAAVSTDQNEKYLFVVDDKNLVRRRDVRLGKLLDNGLRVIETNLKATDRVITEGTQRARIGYPVTPEEKDLTEDMKKREQPAGK
jgi:RND family efflux transporter MFP subunit